METLDRILSNAKIFALKVLGAFGYKPNHPTTLEEIIQEEVWEKPETQSTSPEENEVKKKNNNISFKKLILKDLKNYFHYIRRMKTADKEAYEFYSKMGASLVTNYGIDKKDLKELPARWKQTRPSFGCVFTSIDADIDEKEDGVYPSFMYFTKFKKSPEGIQLAPEGWDVYKATAYFHKKADGKNSKINVALDFCVSVDPDNNVKFLLSKIQEKITVVSKRPAEDGSRFHTFERLKWGIPDIYHDWARKTGMSTEEFMVHMFKDMANFYDASSYMGMVEIRVQKNNTKAKFCIQPQDAVSMFKDRERIGNARKHIFHSVVPHTRIINGKEKHIKLHFRGQRDFVWNGYSINIIVPVRESIVWMPEVDFSAMDIEDKAETPTDAIEFGKDLADKLIGFESMRPTHRA